jgi:general secretion pathway protein D
MSNAILVMGRAEDAEKVDGLLDKLDRKPAQVYLATVIGQLTLGDDFQFGIDYLTALNRNGADTNFSGSSFVARDGTNDALFLGGNATTRAIRDIRNNIITAPFGPTKGLNLYGAIGDSLEVFVTALESTNKFKVLSRPAVFTLNNKKASITSGTIIPVPGDTTVTNNNVITGVEYRDVVLKLEVVPLINPNGEVSLTVSQVNDTVVGSQVVNLNEIPVIGTQQLVTTVTVPSGKTIVLGGLIMDQLQKDTEGMPFLSRIPGLGNLFKENVDSKSRSELLIFIQPRVVTDDFELYNASASEDYRTTVGAEAAAMFPGVVDSKSAPLGSVEPPPEKKGFFSRLFKPRPRDARTEPAPSMKK